MRRPAPHPSELHALRRVAAARASGAALGVHRASTYAGGFVDGVWNDELPAPRLELILELDGHWEVDLGGVRTTHRAFVGGPHAGRVRTRSSDRLRLVQLSIEPLASAALFGMPAGELAGTTVDLEALVGPEAGRLLEALDDAWDDSQEGGDAAARTAEAWAGQRIASAKPAQGAPADVRFAAALLEAGAGRLSVADVATTVGCSRRHLARRFPEWLGTTPTDHQRLLRLDHASSAFRADPAAAIGRVAIDAGYADHSHMVREFHSLVGLTPTDYAARFAA